MSENLSLYEKNQSVLNHCANWTDFPVGTRVKIVAMCEDFHFFYGETGVVTKSSPNYLGIQVRFDEPREFEDGYVQYDFNFKPQSLVVIEPIAGRLYRKLLSAFIGKIGD